MWALAAVTMAALAGYCQWRRSGQTAADYVILATARVYTHLWHRWSARGKAALPAAGPALVVANHTCSADPTFLMAGCPRPIGFAVSRDHYNTHPLVRWLLDHLRCVPVTRDGCDAGAARGA